MSNVKFSQLPNLGAPTATTIIPVVDGVTNYTVTAANLQAFVNNSTGNITTTGNISGAYVLGNGSQLTGLPATYGNANVAVFLPTYSGNLNSVTAVPGAAITGTVALATVAASANSVAGANVTGTVANAAYATSAGSATSATTAGTVTNAAQGNITSVGTLTSLSVTGNITGSYFLGNGSQLTGIAASYGNANVAAFLPTYSGNLNSVSAVPGAAITGTVANAAYATSAGTASSANAVAGANVTGTVANAAYATSAGSATTALSATTAGTVTTAAQPNITSVGTLSSLAVTGNLSANYFLGNGSQLTGITASNVAVIATGANFANTAVANGKMWINGGNTAGNFANTVPLYADNMFIITNGLGNCSIALAPTGDIVINPVQSGGNIFVGGGTRINGISVYSGTITGTAKITGLGTGGLNPSFNGAQYQPASGTATGTIGDICWNASYIYVCTATNTWKRVALSTF